MARTYTPPEGITAPPLTPVSPSNDLTPDTLVVVRHRGGPTIEDRYDGKPVSIPPGEWTMEYGKARHVQRRAIVPGTRNPYEGLKAVSQLAILNLDPPDRCTPLTPELIARFGTVSEAIDRRALVGGGPVKMVATADAMAAVYGRDVTNAELDAQREAPEPVPEGTVLSQIAQAEAEAPSRGRRR